MDLLVEIDNRNAELAVYADERVRFVRDGMSADFLASWDAWGAQVAVKKAVLVAQIPAPASPPPPSSIPVAIITPVEDSTAYGVLHIGAEEDA